MGKKWAAVAWSRELPKPYRNGVFYRIGHHIAVILAGHAHTNGTGITVSDKTIAEEAWCTLKEVEEALKWLEEEKWFTRQQGPKGIEWVCNFEITRNGISEVEERVERKLAAQRARQQRYIEKKKALADSVSNIHQPASAGDVSAGQSLTHPADALTHVADAADAPSSRSSVSTRVINPAHSPASPLKSHEDPKEDPKTRSTADASDSPLTLVDLTPMRKKTKASTPEDTLAKQYYDAMEGNIKYVGTRAIVKFALTKTTFDSVKLGLERLAADPTKPLTRQTLWNAINDHRPGNRFTPRSFDQTDYHDTGGFGA